MAAEECHADPMWMSSDRAGGSVHRIRCLGLDGPSCAREAALNAIARPSDDALDATGLDR